jgi:hypothetical protein
MRSSRTGRTIAIVVTALVLASCSHSAGPSAQPPPPSTVTHTVATSPGDLQAALLTEADMPAGFRIAEDPDTAAPSGGCPPLDADHETRASARAEVLFKGSDFGPYIRERLLRFSDGDAQKLVDMIKSAIDTCRSFAISDETVGSIDFSVAPLDIDSVGEAIAAVRVTGHVAAADLSIFQELVAVRQGRVVIMITQINAGSIDTGLTRSIVHKAAAKARGQR